MAKVLQLEVNVYDDHSVSIRDVKNTPLGDFLWVSPQTMREMRSDPGLQREALEGALNVLLDMLYDTVKEEV